MSGDRGASVHSAWSLEHHRTRAEAQRASSSMQEEGRQDTRVLNALLGGNPAEVRRTLLWGRWSVRAKGIPTGHWCPPSLWLETVTSWNDITYKSPVEMTWSPEILRTGFLQPQDSRECPW